MKTLVLTGGGAPGAYEAGVACGLARRGERFELVVGTSIGALSGALIAQNDEAELERIWRSIASLRPLRPLPAVAPLFDAAAAFGRLRADALPAKVVDSLRGALDALALFPPARLFALEGALDPAPAEALLSGALAYDRLAISLVIATTNVTRTSCDAFYRFADGAAERGASLRRLQPTSHALTRDNYRAAVRASAAVPGAFAPVTIATESRDDSFVDGGVANDTPIGLAIDAGGRDLTIVFLDPNALAGQAMPATNALDVVLASLAVIRQRILEADLKAAEHVNAAIDAGALPEKHRVTLRAIRPAQPLGLSFFGFDDQAKVDAAFERGFADSATFVNDAPCA